MWHCQTPSVYAIAVAPPLSVNAWAEPHFRALFVYVITTASAKVDYFQGPDGDGVQHSHDPVWLHAAVEQAAAELRGIHTRCFYTIRILIPRSTATF